MGKKKPRTVSSSFNFLFSKHGTNDIETHFPVLKKIKDVTELSLLDISSIQSELENILVGVVERIECLKHESKGKDLPASIISSRQVPTTSDAFHNQSHFNPSLIVKANPDKPLTLIISQRAQSQTTLSDLLPSFGRNKANCGQQNVQKSNRAVIEDSTQARSSPSPDKNQNAPSYAIPNKFWEMMEPYCAEITESNVGYLENLIRSYQELESKYFQLPLFKLDDTSRLDEGDAPAHKRLRRDLSQASPNVLPNGVGGSTIGSSTQVTNPNFLALSKCLELELRRPISESSTLSSAAQSLLDMCYRDYHHHNPISTHKGFESELETQQQQQVGLTDAFDYHHQQSPNHAHESSSPRFSNPSVPMDAAELTTCASQPLKALAKSLHVSSSYRIEKKIVQAVDELGLLPTNLMDSIINDNDVARPTYGPTNTRAIDLPCQNFDCESPYDESAAAAIKTSPFDSPVSNRANSTVKRRTNKLALHDYANLNGLNDDTSKLPDSYAQSNDVHLDASLTTTNSISACKPKLHSDAHKTKIIWSSKNASRKKLRKLKKALGYKTKLRNNFFGLQKSAYNGHVSDSLDDGQTDTNDAIVHEKTDDIHTLPNGLINANDDSNIECRVSERTAPKKGDILSRLRPNVHQNEVGKKAAAGPNHVSPNALKLKYHHSSPNYNLHYPNNFEDSNDHVESTVRLFSECGRPSDILDVASHNTSIEANGALVREPDDRHIIGAGHCKNLDFNQILHLNGPASDELCDSNSLADSPDSKTRININCMEGLTKMGLGASHLLTKDEILSINNCRPLASPRLDEMATAAGAASAVESSSLANDDIGWAIVQRQRELRLCCAANHNILRRLVQAARRDMQRQEIQRRLAIADADVIEAYNKLESYRPHRKPPLKRDRDLAWKALKERGKILKELEAFDCKSP